MGLDASAVDPNYEQDHFWRDLQWACGIMTFIFVSQIMWLPWAPKKDKPAGKRQ